LVSGERIERSQRKTPQPNTFDASHMLVAVKAALTLRNPARHARFLNGHKDGWLNPPGLGYPLCADTRCWSLPLICGIDDCKYIAADRSPLERSASRKNGRGAGHSTRPKKSLMWYPTEVEVGNGVTIACVYCGGMSCRCEIDFIRVSLG
jgi:hypothetical protein